LETLLANEEGPFIAVTDSMRAVADQISPWVPGGLTSLGTDGFGRSDSRKALRRWFEVDAEHIAVAVLHALMERKEVAAEKVGQAIRDLGIDPEQPYSLRQ
jgi:pyruvate dehydrogenase E1 component